MVAKQRLALAILLSALLSFVHASGSRGDSSPSAVDARDVVARAFANLYGFSSIQQVEIRSKLADQRAFVRKAQVIRQGVSDGPNRMLIRFMEPDDLRDTALLLREQEDHSYLSWIYQPMFRRTRSVSIAQRHDKLFGTDLAFEDLEAKRARDWDAALVRADEALGRPTWVIDLVPHAIPSGYERMRVWFDRERPVVVRLVAYRNGIEFKRIEMLPDSILKRESYQIPTRLEITSGGDARTTVSLTDIEIVAEIPARVFTRNALEQGDSDTDVRSVSRGSSDRSARDD